MSFYRIVEGLKKVQCNKSPWIFSWENHVLKERPHVIISKNHRLTSSISKNIPDGIFYLYRQNPEFCKHRTNLVPIFSLDTLDISQKLGYVILDTFSQIDTKNMLKIFEKYIDEKTVFFSPKIINFEGYENKVIDGILTFCSEKGMKIEWKAHNGDVQLYDIRDIGYNQGATFSITK